MTLASALLRRRDPEERAVYASDVWAAWARGEDFGATADTPAGVQVTRRSALGLSAVWACTSLIADSIATLPCDTVVSDENGVRHPFRPRPDWLDQPNPEQTWVDFVFNTVTSLLIDGSAFIYTVRDRKGDVAEAWVLDPNWVQVRREFTQTGNLRLVYYVMVAKGQQSPVGPFRVEQGPEMFQINAFQTNSGYPRGLPPLEIARLMLGGGIAGQEMGARFFGHGMNSSGVIEHPGDMTTDQAKQLKRDFKEANAGFRKHHLPPVLTGGATYKQISISPEQAQFLEHREFTVQDIARWFRVPPHMIGDLQRTTSWGTGIEYQQITFVTYTLRPWLERLEESWSRWMLMAQNQFGPPSKVRARFDTDGLLRGDKKAQAAWFAAGRQWGWTNVDEIRAELGKDPLPDGKGQVFLEPVNMQEVGTTEDDEPTADQLAAAADLIT